MNDVSPEQEIINWLYEQLDEANRRLAALGKNIQIQRLLIEKNETPPRQPEPESPAYTGMMCGDCGSHRMVRTGSCETCQDCGAAGGCG